MIDTILVDGRRVQAEECFSLEEALFGLHHRPEITSWNKAKGDEWHVTCQCCGGYMEHTWSPSGHGVDPNGGHYQCGPCCGRGVFKIQLP
jgi:hypothetical protein